MLNSFPDFLMTVLLSPLDPKIVHENFHKVVHEIVTLYYVVIGYKLLISL